MELENQMKAMKESGERIQIAHDKSNKENGELQVQITGMATKIAKLESDLENAQKINEENTIRQIEEIQANHETEIRKLQQNNENIVSIHIMHFHLIVLSITHIISIIYRYRP